MLFSVYCVGWEAGSYSPHEVFVVFWWQLINTLGVLILLSKSLSLLLRVSRATIAAMAQPYWGEVSYFSK